MSRGRKPRPDELDLWRKVASTAERSLPERSEAQKAVRQKPRPDIEKFHDAVPKRPKSRSNISTSVDLAPTLSESFGKQAVQMDRKAFGNMLKGKLSPEARLDLHGMTLDRAHGALTRFVLSQHAAGKRLVLVITGKGKVRDDHGPIPVRMGVLRHQVPQWLAMAPLRGAVLQVSPAHHKHGGAGAYYVYLRKPR